MSELQKNQLLTAAVTGYTAEGLGVARVDGRVVFVHGGVRGEVCSLRILKVRKSVAYARVEEVLERSPARAAVISGISLMRRSWRPSGSGWKMLCAG